jgi:hypothetical protein
LKPPRALVIGIDAYSNPAWGLTGAVRDALAFADWVTQAGGVAPADLRLLLAPAPDATPLMAPAGTPAPGAPTSQGIINALAELRKLKPEEGGDRVYVYYAGHGAALKGFNEPILIPVDFSDPEIHGQLLLGFSKVIDYLGPAPFLEQIFFLDACRDFSLPGYEVPLQSPVGTYRPAKGKAKQYVLYSVAPGQQATEIGVGIWTKTLLDGLEGRSYKPVSLRLGQFVVRLDDLAQWINSEVHERLVNATLATASAVQEPEYVPDPKGVNPVLTAFSKEAAPRARVSVFVEPALALSTCRVEVKEYSAAHAGGLVLVTSGPLPPIAPPLEFELFPSEYSIEAQADHFVVVSQPWTVTDDPVIELTLEEAQGAPAPPPPAPPPPPDEGPDVGRSAETAWRGSFGLDDFELEARGVRGTDRRRSPREMPKKEPPPASGPGTLTVRCQDPFVRVKLLNAKRKEVEERLDVGKPLPLAPGIYRLRAWLPGDRPSESTVEVRPGRPTEVNLKVPVPRLGPLQIEWLKERGMEDQASLEKSAYLQPSELLGRVAGVRLGSLLAYAAYAANWNGPYFNKLRSFGVPPFPERGEQACGVLLLVGAAGGQNAGEIEGFLRGCGADLLRDGQILAAGSFTPLFGLPAGAAWQTVVDRPGPLRADLRLPGFGSTRYALAALPGRLSVLVAVLESDGTVDVQQILLPLVSGTPWRDFLDQPENVRSLDIALRAWEAHERHPLPEHDLNDLLAGRWIDPILACVAGYSLVRAGEPERFLGKVRPGSLDDLDPETPPRARRLGKSALVNLLSLFPGLPDAWVLAGLCDPVGEEDWFAKAVRCGVPLFAEGLRALGERPELAEPLAGLLPGSPWTAWTVKP